MKYLAPIFALVLLSGCMDNRKPGVEYAPQMYHSIPYEPYSQTDYNVINKEATGDGRNVMMPVEGTVARGKADYYYEFEDTPEGYEEAGAKLKNPLEATEDVLAAGKALYQVQCQHCHGAKGDGQGPLNASEQYADRVPAYSQRLPTINEGKAFHSITYGRNNVMGAHAYALNPTERWQIVTYIYSLIGGGEAAAPAAEANADAPAEEGATN